MPDNTYLSIFNNQCYINKRYFVNSLEVEKLDKEDEILIFKALNSDEKDNILDAEEINSIWNKMKKYAAMDDDLKELSTDELTCLLKELILNDNQNLFSRGITPIKFFNFINNYLLKNDNKMPTDLPHINLLKSFGFNNIDISSNISNETYINEIMPAFLKFTQDKNIYNSNKHSKSIDDCRLVIDSFILEYGSDLKSTTREELLLGTTFKNTEKARSDYFKCNSDNLSERVKYSKFCNCGDARTLIKEIFKQKLPSNKYNVNSIAIEHEHIAALIKDPDNNEYVIDMWLNPQGGLYKRCDWEKIMSNLYPYGDIKILDN